MHAPTSRHALYISYNGMLEPLGQSQVLPYLKGLSKFGWRFTLLSYEREQAYTGKGQQHCRQLANDLMRFDIDWHYLRYHQKPSLPATAYDVAAGIWYASRLLKHRKVELVHARAQIAAVIALALKRRFGPKLIFDVRGLMAEEYIDAGHWRAGSIPSRVTKAGERRAFAGADGVVTLTERIWPIIKEWEGLRDRNVAHEVIPCCADLQRFRFSSDTRDHCRRELGIADRFVLIYSGSIDGWYLTEEMADFFATFARKKPNAVFLWLTRSSRERIQAVMRARHIDESSFKIVAALPQDVPKYLAAGDAGLAFIKPCFSKLASSPTKYAEYLGCGLPLVINAGIGDSDALITQHNCGVLMQRFAETDYAEAVDQLDQFTANAAATRSAMHKVAELLFDLNEVGVARYARLYQRLISDDSQGKR
jgi:glycosyltransferase involved in cell wall biosynthesis